MGHRVHKRYISSFSVDFQNGFKQYCPSKRLKIVPTLLQNNVVHNDLICYSYGMLNDAETQRWLIGRLVVACGQYPATYRDLFAAIIFMAKHWGGKKLCDQLRLQSLLSQPFCGISYNCMETKMRKGDSYMYIDLSLL